MVSLARSFFSHIGCLSRPHCLWMAFVALSLLGGLNCPAHASLEEQSVKAPLASRSLLLDGVTVNGLSVAVGEMGHIMLSNDNGSSWRQADVPTRTTLTGVFFLDKNLGWAVGHDQVILRTQDGGVNWQRVYDNPEAECPLLDVWFKDAQNGFAIGAYGYFLTTTDGGESWNDQPFSSKDLHSNEDELVDAGDDFDEDDDAALGGDFHLNHITRSASGRLYISAEAGNIYRSDDEGQSWLTLPSPYAGSFFGTLPLEDDVLLLFGLRGHLFRSEDAGESWQQVETGIKAMLTSAEQLSNGTIIITGLGGTVFISKDGGKSITQVPQPNRRGITTVVEASDGTPILIGEFGVRSLDAGKLN